MNLIKNYTAYKNLPIHLRISTRAKRMNITLYRLAPLEFIVVVPRNYFLKFRGYVEKNIFCEEFTAFFEKMIVKAGLNAHVSAANTDSILFLAQDYKVKRTLLPKVIRPYYKVDKEQKVFEIYYTKDCDNEGFFEGVIKLFYEHEIEQLTLPFVAKYYRYTGLKPTELKFKYFKNCYGKACKKKHDPSYFKITVNPILAQYNLALLESTYIHELAHHEEMNHSKKFYEVYYHYLALGNAQDVCVKDYPCQIMYKIK